MRLFIAVAVLLFSPVALWSQYAPQTRQQTLAELTREAQTIVRGRVVSAVVENHPKLTHLRTVVVTLSVSETLKGEAGETFTFRQFMWNTRATIPPVEYRPGSEVMLLMIRPSQYGLSSPAGLEQGAFKITKNTKGELVATNGRNNLGLFANVTSDLAAAKASVSGKAMAVAQQQQAGPIGVTTLGELIRGLAGGK